ncbi:unnamed protein product [Orchesella dallaii]|uniref:Uncharacterized protein n=1 Tax=Orchesella dallaii TaxID=48710 RepID=A0ABP1RK22_9HEXA
MEVVFHPYLEPIYPNLHRVNDIDLGAVTLFNEIPNVANRKYGIISNLHTARKVKADESIHGHILRYINNAQDLDEIIINIKNILEIRRNADLHYETRPTWQIENRKLLW